MKTIKICLICSIITIVSSQQSSSFLVKEGFKQLDSNQDKNIGEYKNGLRCFDYYQQENNISQGECQQNCLKDEQCQGVSFTKQNEVEQCFYFNQNLPKCEYNNLGWESALIIKQLSGWQEDTRCVNYYLYQEVESEDQCAQNCDNDEQCYAVSFYETESKDEKWCFYFNQTRPFCEPYNNIFKSAFVFSQRKISDLQNNTRCHEYFANATANMGSSTCQYFCNRWQGCAAVSFEEQTNTCFYSNISQLSSCTSEDADGWQTSYTFNRTIGSYQEGLRCQNHYKSFKTNEESECLTECYNDIECTATTYNYGKDEPSCFFFNQETSKCEYNNDDWKTALISWRSWTE